MTESAFSLVDARGRKYLTAGEGSSVAFWPELPLRPGQRTRRIPSRVVAAAMELSPLTNGLPAVRKGTTFGGAGTDYHA